MVLLRVSLRIAGDYCFDLLLVVLLFPLKLCTNNPATSTQPNPEPHSSDKLPLTLCLASHTYDQYNVYATQGYTFFPCRPCAFDGPSERVGNNFKTYQKVRTTIRFGSKFTILPFLYHQVLYHLFTIIYFGTSLHRSHVISHTLKLNHVSPNVRYTRVYKGFIPLLIYRGDY